MADRLSRYRLEDAGLPMLIGGSEPQQALSGSGPTLHVDCSSFASMAAVRLPDMPGVAKSSAAAQELRSRLRHEHAVEAPVVAWEGALWVRVSAAMYNSAADFEALAAAVAAAGERAGADRAMSPLPSMHALDGIVKRERSQRDEAVTDTLVGDGTDASAADADVEGSEAAEEVGEKEYGGEHAAQAESHELFSAEEKVKASGDSVGQGEWDEEAYTADGPQKGTAEKGKDAEGPWPVGVNLVADKTGVKVDLSMAH